MQRNGRERFHEIQRVDAYYGGAVSRQYSGIPREPCPRRNSGHQRHDGMADVGERYRRSIASCDIPDVRLVDMNGVEAFLRHGACQVRKPKKWK